MYLNRVFFFFFLSAFAFVPPDDRARAHVLDQARADERRQGVLGRVHEGAAAAEAGGAREGRDAPPRVGPAREQPPGAVRGVQEDGQGGCEFESIDFCVIVLLREVLRYGTTFDIYIFFFYRIEEIFSCIAVRLRTVFCVVVRKISLVLVCVRFVGLSRRQNWSRFDVLPHVE